MRVAVPGVVLGFGAQVQKSELWIVLRVGAQDSVGSQPEPEPPRLNLTPEPETEPDA